MFTTILSSLHLVRTNTSFVVLSVSNVRNKTPLYYESSHTRRVTGSRVSVSWRAFLAVDPEHVDLEILRYTNSDLVKVHSSGRCVGCLKGVIYWDVGWHSSHVGIVSETEEPG